MRRITDVPSRGEVTERTDKSREDMREKEERMDVTATDVETIRETLESLEPGGTAEGSEEVETIVQEADDDTVEVFDEQNEELEELQHESEEHQTEIQDLSDANERNLGKLSDASAKMETDVAVSEFVDAKETAIRDTEFLEDEIKKAEQAREESDRIQQEYERRVRARSAG